jgi:hypothetical protein
MLLKAAVRQHLENAEVWLDNIDIETEESADAVAAVRSEITAALDLLDKD